jgi:hypothetical protein
MLRQMGAGMGSIGLAAMLAAREPSIEVSEHPLAPRPPHFAPRAKRVIQLFMAGGPSHLDTFDYKPDLAKYAGQRPKEVDIRTLRKTNGGLFPSPYEFARHGKCGQWVSEIFPHVAGCVDDICFLHSMHTNIPEHAGAINMFNMGHLQPNRPSMGSWLVYGLGSENENLPGFVAMSPRAKPRGRKANWGNAFLPGEYAGSYVNLARMRPDAVLRDLRNPHLTSLSQRRQVDLWKRLSALHLEHTGKDHGLEASIEAMEMAFRMQFAVPDVFDVRDESASTLALYGEGEFSKGCLIARRLSERGVRVVQLTLSIDGYDIPWDTGHGEIENGHRVLAKACDQGIAGLLTDLKRRGQLDETLVVWGGEFGRAPTSEGAVGRDHNHMGFTVWMAGGGVKPGIRYGATDHFGLRAVENRLHVHDLQATILHLMGLDHERLTYRHSGRDYRLTDVHGQVIEDILL